MSTPNLPLPSPTRRSRPAAWLVGFGRLLGWFRGGGTGAITDLAQLQQHVREDATFLAQGSSYSYLRARSGTHAERLFRDPAFAAALNRCKWEGFAAAAADLLLLVELELRPHNLPPPELTDALADTYARVLSMEHIPEHRQDHGWAAEIHQFSARAETALRSPPVPLRKICQHTGGTILKFAPVTDEVRHLDRSMVHNNVEFRFIDRLSAMRRRLNVNTMIREFAMRGAELAARRRVD